MEVLSDAQAALAKNVHYQFAASQPDLQQLLDDYDQRINMVGCEDPPLRGATTECLHGMIKRKRLTDIIMVSVLGLVERLTPNLDGTSTVCEKLGKPGNTLANRSTKKPDRDEWICIATLLGLSTFNFPHPTPEENLIEIITSTKVVPLGLLFSGRPRFTRLGYHWMPRSLIMGEAPYQEPFWNDTPCKLTNDGLNVTQPRVLLKPAPFLHKTNSKFRFQMEDFEALASITTESTPFRTPGLGNANIGVIFSQSLKLTSPARKGALVIVHGFNGTGGQLATGQLLCTWKTRVIIAPSRRWVGVKMDEVEELGPAFYVPETQRWCVD